MSTSVDYVDSMMDFRRERISRIQTAALNPVGGSFDLRTRIADTCRHYCHCFYVGEDAHSSLRRATLAHQSEHKCRHAHGWYVNYRAIETNQTESTR